MNTELDKIKAKIVALASKTIDNGCTEAEAMASMAMVGRLLQSYNLTMEECDVRKSKCVTVHIPLNRETRGPTDRCVNQLAQFFSGRAWFHRGYVLQENGKYVRQVSYAFFVQEHDVEALKYLHGVIARGIDGETRAFQRGALYCSYHKKDKRRATSSFQRGMADRIGARLLQMKRENEAAMQASKSTGNALMVLKGQLIEEEFKGAGISLRTVTHRYHHDWGAHAYGHEAGDRVNLNRPLNDGDGVAGLLR